MSKLRSVVMILPIAASLLALIPTAVAQAPEGAPREAAAGKNKKAPESPVVGVIEIGKVVQQYPRFIELNTELEKRFTERNNQLKALAQQLEELRGTIQVIEDENERAEREFELQMGLQRQDFLRKSFAQRTQVEQDRALLKVYQDVDVAIGRVAAQKGVSVVLRYQEIKPSATSIDNMDVREVTARVQAYENRKVWFASKELDITSDVIKFLLTPLEPNKPKDGKE